MIQNAVTRLGTGVEGLDHLLGGGLPEGTMTLLAGPPGAGKTTLAQQISFAAARRGASVLYMTTLSEPSAKLLRYLRPFAFFDAQLFHERIHVVDLGQVLRGDGFEQTVKFIAEHLQRFQPQMVVIDSFKVFDDLARSSSELRTFSYEIAVNLLAWQTTSLLIGEYAESESETNPIFSVSDGLIRLSHHHAAGEPQRLMTVVKMRGTAHSRDSHPFVISAQGAQLLARAVQPGAARGEDSQPAGAEERMRLGIPSVDALLGAGVPAGSGLLVAGPSGTGKTVLGLQFLYEGSRQFDERGIFFSVQESRANLVATAKSFGWDLEREISEGRLELLCVPYPEIRVDADLLRLCDRVRRFGARRLVVDSTSTLFHGLGPSAVRSRFYLLADLLREVGGVGMLLSETAFGAATVTHFGDVDAVADGVLLLESLRVEQARERHLEVVKLRNTAHRLGSFPMRISDRGFEVVGGPGKERGARRRRALRK